MARPHSLALAVVWGLLTAAPAWAQPSGSGWLEVARCDSACGDDAVILPALPEGGEGWQAESCFNGACARREVFAFDDGSGVQFGVYTNSCDYFPDPPYSVCHPWVVFSRPLFSSNADPSEAERIEDLFQLWGLALGSLAALWAMKTFVLKLLTNQ